MANYKTLTTAFITEYGEWGKIQDIIVFNHKHLTQQQWDIMSELPDNIKIKYAIACLEGNKIAEEMLSK